MISMIIATHDIQAIPDKLASIPCYQFGSNFGMYLYPKNELILICFFSWHSPEVPHKEKNTIQCYLLLTFYIFTVQRTAGPFTERDTTCIIQYDDSYQTTCISSTFLRLHLDIFIRYKILFSSYN